jgi:hypothetical protein
MNKPEKKTISRTSYDWSESVKWIEQKLGRKLRDYGAKFEGENKSIDNVYRDYWHYICDIQEISNPCYIYVSSEWIEFGDAEDWQNEITQAFIDEFGDEEEFRVEW